MVGFKLSEMRDQFLVRLAPPRTIPKPQRMGMAWTLRPHGIDKLIVNVLLGIVDDALYVAFDVIDEQPKPDCIVLGQEVMPSADCRMQVFDKKPDKASLI